MPGARSRLVTAGCAVALAVPATPAWAQEPGPRFDGVHYVTALRETPVITAVDLDVLPLTARPVRAWFNDPADEPDYACTPHRDRWTCAVSASDAPTGLVAAVRFTVEFVGGATASAPVDPGGALGPVGPLGPLAPGGLGSGGEGGLGSGEEGSSANGADPSDSSAALPTTGSTWLPLGWAVQALVAGLCLLVLARRRRSP